MNIALIAGTYQPQQCGVAHYTAHLRTALSERGIQSTVLTTRQAAQILDSADSADPTVQGVVNRWHLSELLALVQSIHQINPDLLHIQHAAGTYGFDRSIFLLPLLLRLSGWRASIVATLHEYGWWEWQPRLLPALPLEWLKQWGQQQGWWDREDGFLLTQSDAIITTNSDAERVVCQRLPQLQPIVHRIPIAANITASMAAMTDRQQVRRDVRQQLGWEPLDDVQIIVFFSFLHPVKGIETLLLAFQQVLAVRFQTRLLLIGGVESLALPAAQADRYWQKLQVQIANLDLTTTVQMTGYLHPDQVSRYLYAADVGVLPFNSGVTLKSGSLLAMMAHGLPIVTTLADPSDPDLTPSRVKQVAPRHPDQLAAALTELLSDPAQRQQFATATASYSQHLSWTAIAESHLQIYQRLVP
jgi:glycosyltransferase involved in cell wall biosynthesis